MNTANQKIIDAVFDSGFYTELTEDEADYIGRINAPIRVHIEREWVDSWSEEHVRIFIAHPEWVENYHRSGGTWAYAD